MIYEKNNLRDYYNIAKDSYLTSYCQDNYKEYSKGRLRPAVLILPGGGYEFVSKREGEPIALRLNSYDIAAFILDYTVGEFTYPTPIAEAVAAIAYIRCNYKKYNIDPNRIYALGFSAGGHLAGCLALASLDNEFSSLLGIDKMMYQLNGLLLGYPVITMDKEKSHLGSVERITQNKEKLIEKLSIEKHIRKGFPKTFIWLCSDDAIVPPYNSLKLTEALLENGIYTELHMYPKGGHGLSTADLITNSSESLPKVGHPEEWLRLAVNFILNK